ncbi:MAG: DUF1028 domain-containing protein [Calditrichia bacterium]|nr:DUF1028 domain-containing protein [Calditrichia bacterium]
MKISYIIPLVKKIFFILIFSLSTQCLAGNEEARGNKTHISTFSIVARDPDNSELGVAVASRFFAVGSVVPWAEADIGAIATQSFANTSFGWRGLTLIDNGLTPEEALEVLLREDENPQKRQIGIVDHEGLSATYTGEGCIAWAGGRTGENYAVQGNILTGEDVVIAMEKAFLETNGTLAERMYAALLAGDEKGGDSRGKQSAAILIVKVGAGYGGYTDLAIDIRVDDHAEPFKELGRLLKIAEMNYAWNEGWTLFNQKKYQQALPPMERAVQYVPDNPELLYDLAVIQLANSDTDKSLITLEKALGLNPKLKTQAAADQDLEKLKNNPDFKKLIKK